MSNSGIPQPQSPAPSFLDFEARLHTLEQAFQASEWQLMCQLRVAIPGTIESFDPQKQTVTVQLAIRENILLNLKPTPVTIRPIVDVPIIMMRAGGYTLALPVGIGDECLVIFGDMCMDSWWASGGVQNQDIRRRHDLSDGFAIIGPWSQPRVLPNFPTATAQLRSDDGLTKVEVDSNGTVTVQAQHVIINGATDVHVNGNGQTFIEGKNFLLHRHTGVQTGGGTSGPVL